MEINEPVLESQAGRPRPAPAVTDPLPTHPKSTTLALCTAGRLGNPPKVPIRDYTMDDATRVALIDEDSLLDTVFHLLASVTQGSVDVNNLHEEEAKQILLHVFLNYWNTTIELYPYTPDEADMEALEKRDPARALKVKSGQENLWCTVPLVDGAGVPRINARPIPPGFKEPFYLPGKDGHRYGFRLPRMADLRDAKAKADRKYAPMEQEFYDVQDAVERISSLKKTLGELMEEEVVLPMGIPAEMAEDEMARLKQERKQDIEATRTKILDIMKSVDPNRKRTHDKMLRERALDLVRFKHSACIKSIDGEPANEDSYDQVPATVWQDFARTLEKYKFGVDGRLMVKSPVTGGPVEQDIRFRILDLIPASVSGEAEQLDVQFD